MVNLPPPQWGGLRGVWVPTKISRRECQHLENAQIIFLTHWLNGLNWKEGRLLLADARIRNGWENLKKNDFPIPRSESDKTAMSE